MTENGDRQFAPRGPVEIGKFLGAKAQELDQLNVLLQQAHETLEGAEEAWVKHFDEIMDQIEEEYAKGKIPGADLRVSIARRRGGADKWTNYRRAEKLVKRLEKQATIAANVISAAQSEGNMLRVGAT